MHERMMGVGAGRGQPVVALLGGGDRFEDFYDKIGVSFETFRTRLTGGWIFNYVEALQSAGIRTVLIVVSARVDVPRRFMHSATGATVWMLPSPRLHRKVRSASQRWAPRSDVLASVASYLATPIRMLMGILRSESCDAMLCQEYEYARFDVCTLLGRILGRPVFATYQGADHTVSWLERPFRRLSLRYSSGLIIGASTEIRRVRSVYRVPAAKIAKIPNPVDVTGWHPVDRRRVRNELAIPQAARVVEWHGHVQIRRKGLDVLLDAWELICAQRPRGELLLLLIGTGRNTAELRERVKTNPRIKWIDRYILDREELSRYLCAADVYTLPSRHEGFAVAPLEAMASGLPVVAADASGVADLLSGGEEAGGLIVPREDPAALAAALLRLLDDEALARQLGERARRRAEQEFSIEVVGRRLRRALFAGQGASRGT